MRKDLLNPKSLRSVDSGGANQHEVINPRRDQELWYRKLRWPLAWKTLVEGAFIASTDGQRMKRDLADGKIDTGAWKLAFENLLYKREVGP